LLINTRSNNFIDLSLHVWSMLGKRVSTEPFLAFSPHQMHRALLHQHGFAGCVHCKVETCTFFIP
ncbi:hypothetical protein, partial [Methanoculleus sp.]|uniref:hypothetical protein n=1 Tax=Methanoculleus sp. TaxID=90427 RepID=UPI00272E2BA8